MATFAPMNQDYILPAEWQKQSALMLTWPHADTDWSPYLEEITDTFIQMARAIACRQPLIISAPKPDLIESMLSAFLPASSMQNIHIYKVETNDTWARDHGPITLLAEGKKPLLLDFKFNGWGEKFEAELDNKITSRLYRAKAFDADYKSHLDFVLEGGSIESDGKGTIFTTSQCLLAPHRNQPMKRDDIEKYLLTSLHAKQIVWLDYGNLMGDDTDGHIDTIVRIAPNDTILYMAFDDESDMQYEEFIALENQIKELKTIDGQPYRLLRLPAPDALFDGNERLPATYANFVILNGAILVPTYNQPAKDEEAMRIISEAFPGYEIVGIDACTVVRQHGSLHCLTMQIPAEK